MSVVLEKLVMSMEWFELRHWPLVFMALTKKGFESLENFTDGQLEDLVKSNDALDREEVRWVQEQREEEERKGT